MPDTLCAKIRVPDTKNTVPDTFCIKNSVWDTFSPAFHVCLGCGAIGIMLAAETLYHGEAQYAAIRKALPASATQFL